MAKLSKRLEKELEQARARIVTLKEKHDVERMGMDAAEMHAAERVAFLEKSLASAMGFEG